MRFDGSLDLLEPLFDEFICDDHILEGGASLERSHGAIKGQISERDSVSAGELVGAVFQGALDEAVDRVVELGADVVVQLVLCDG